MKWTREEVADLLIELVCKDSQGIYETGVDGRSVVNIKLDRIASHLNAYGITPPTLMARLDRFEAKLDTLIEALADEDDKPMLTLDGEPLPQDRLEGEEL